jgi:prepilin-type N-terminal cleavage/methylation domain-containing protein
MRKNSKGFTLMETLIAAALFVIVTSSAFSIFTMGMQIWRRTRDISRSDRQVMLALERMGQDVREMARIFPKPEGFSIQKSPSFEYKSTASELQIPVLYGPGEHPLMAGLGRTIYRHNTPTQEICRTQETAAQLYEEKRLECRAVASRVMKFQVRYLLPSGLEGSYSWYDTWDSQDALPIAVEIKIELSPETRYGFKREYKKTIAVPVGGQHEPQTQPL